MALFFCCSKHCSLCGLSVCSEPDEELVSSVVGDDVSLVLGVPDSSVLSSFGAFIHARFKNA